MKWKAAGGGGWGGQDSHHDHCENTGRAQCCFSPWDQSLGLNRERKHNLSQILQRRPRRRGRCRRTDSWGGRGGGGHLRISSLLLKHSGRGRRRSFMCQIWGQLRCISTTRQARAQSQGWGGSTRGGGLKGQTTTESSTQRRVEG